MSGVPGKAEELGSESLNSALRGEDICTPRAQGCRVAEAGLQALLPNFLGTAYMECPENTFVQWICHKHPTSPLL